jgi:predicted acyltransferase (DUF342 family)
MAFPASPINGQTTTVNGILYTYDSTQTAWVRTSTSVGGDVNAINGNFSGNISVTGNSTITGNSTFASNVTVTGSNTTLSNTTVTGNLTINGNINSRSLAALMAAMAGAS